jgi:hypothetical protein
MDWSTTGRQAEVDAREAANRKGSWLTRLFTRLSPPQTQAEADMLEKARQPRPPGAEPSSF